MKIPKSCAWSLCALIFLTHAGLTHGQTYAGQATAVRTTVSTAGQPLVTKAVADTGPLNGAGGTVSLSSVGVTLPSVLTAGNSTSSVTGSGSATNAQASVDSVNISIAGITLTANIVSSSAQISCPAYSRSGSSNIASLTLNGSSVSVSGAPNQFVSVLFGGAPIGTLTINEQVLIPGSITVNALHLSVTDPFNSDQIDVVISSSRTGINCAVSPPFNFIRGRGTGLRLTQSSPLSGVVGTIISDTGPLPTAGGSRGASTTGAGLAPILTTGLVSASASGGSPGGTPNSSQSSSNVNNAVLSLGGPLGVTLSFDALSTSTQCTASAGTVNCTGTSSISNLQVTALGSALGITVTGLPNQVVTLPGGLGTLVLNEQFGLQTGSPAELTVNGLKVQLNVPGLAATDVVFASSQSGLYAPSSPTAGEASISGRVTDANGRPLARISVVLTAGDGMSRIALTSAFGYYRFDDLLVNEAYLISIRGKRYRFEPRFVNLSDSLVDVDFTPIE